MTKLTDRTCRDLPRGTPPLGEAEIAGLMTDISPGWRRGDGALRRRVETGTFARALDLVNAVGALAEREGHHPDLSLGWGYVVISFTTHSVGGLSENDFICAAKTDALIDGGSVGG